MRPPESVARTRDVVIRIRRSMMQTMIGGPAYRRTRAVKYREESQYLAHDGVEFERAMRDRAMVADRRADAADPCERQRAEEDGPSGQRKHDQSHQRGHVDQDDPSKDSRLARGGTPPRPFPGSQIFPLGSFVDERSYCYRCARRHLGPPGARAAPPGTV